MTLRSATGAVIPVRAEPGVPESDPTPAFPVGRQLRGGPHDAFFSALSLATPPHGRCGCAGRSHLLPRPHGPRGGAGRWDPGLLARGGANRGLRHFLRRQLDERPPARRQTLLTWSGRSSLAGDRDARFTLAYTRRPQAPMSLCHGPAGLWVRSPASILRYWSPRQG